MTNGANPTEPDRSAEISPNIPTCQIEVRRVPIEVGSLEIKTPFPIGKPGDPPFFEGPTPHEQIALDAFLYLLMRDKLPTGDVIRLLTQAEEAMEAGGAEYSSKHLADYAQEIRTRLMMRAKR